jgi:uncharacterized protein YndB with AHSA1/START domain
VTEPSLPPVKRAVSVTLTQEAAFRRFAHEFAAWWPRRSHSIGAERVKDVVLEPRVGGRIFEEHVDGRRFQWGQILEWDPPKRLKFTFHPARAPETAQDVEVRFMPETTGTRVELVATKWENWGKKAKLARRGYNLGWGYVLNVWAERRTTGMRLVDGIGAIINGVNKLRGGTAAQIRKAGGEIAPAPRVEGR